LNSGDVFRPGAAGKMYKVKGSPKGTADCLVLQKEVRIAKISLNRVTYTVPRPIFIEFKSDKGKQTPEQKAFEETVKQQGYEYYVIRSIDELVEVLK
jgi:hypothetical protein